MIPRHLSRRTRFILLIVSTLLFSVGAFLWLIADLEQAASSTSVPGAATHAVTVAQPASVQTTAIETDAEAWGGAVIANGVSIPVELAIAAAQERGLSNRRRCRRVRDAFRL